MNVSKTIFTTTVGSYLELASNVTPFGYLKLDNTLVLKADYPRLYLVVGDKHALGGDSDATKFRLPPSEDIVFIGSGQGTGLTNRVIGAKGGVIDVTLTEAQMPSHTHIQNSHNHSSTLVSTGGATLTNTPSAAGALTSGTGDTSASTAVNQNAGGGLSHTNMQPYIAMTKYIKY